MNALVPYVAPLIDQGAINTRLSSLAAAAFASPMALDYGRQANKAAKRIQKAFRTSKFKRRGPAKRQRIGEQPGSDSSKRYEVISNNNTARSTRTLYSTELTVIPETNTTNDIDSRQREIAYVSGFKLCFEFYNELSKAAYCNVAVLSPKQVDGGPGNAVTTSSDFFRGNGGLNRDQDFNLSLTALERHCLPVNSDQYHVLLHNRFTLHASDNTQNYIDNSGACYTHKSYWVPLKRQVRWRGLTSSNAAVNGAVFLVYWFDQFAEPGGNAAISPGVDVTGRGGSHFKFLNF